MSVVFLLINKYNLLQVASIIIFISTYIAHKASAPVCFWIK